MKDLSFELSVPADPAFRSLVAAAAGKYGESLGMPGAEARAFEASLQEAVDLSAASGSGEVHLTVERDSGQLEVTIAAGGTSTTVARSLAGARTT
ncbi:MAG: hypothetical protein M3R55_11525 [Acidobacteriota bacterium]|nr:hypothetical protein [Acidobacteriota bacterium]